MTNRRDKIIEALAGVDLAAAYFTWSTPNADDSFYTVRIILSNASPAGWKIWDAPTRDEALAVRQEMEDLANAARRLTT